MSKCLLLFVLLGGCSRSDGRDTTPAKPATTPAKPATTPAIAERDVPCEQVAEHWGHVMAESGEEAQVRFASQYRDVFARRCTADTWSIELKRCLLRVKSLGANGCTELATPEQEEALASDIMLMVNEK